jgi:uncharacterized protein
LAIRRRCQNDEMVPRHEASMTSPQSSPSASSELLDALRGWFATVGDVVVAFSGGADSALVAAVAAEQLGDRALAVTAVSPSLAGREADDCALLAREWGLNWTTVTTDEMESAAYRANDADRCFHCKTALMDALAPVLAERSAVPVLGVNLDDLADHRPGQRAAIAAGARFPLVETGFTKASVREVSRLLSLRTWDKPAAACLASRIEHGRAVSVTLLARVDRAEDLLVGLGLGQLRVRHHGDTARIEVEPVDFARVIESREVVVDGLQRLGYRYVTLDLAGFRSGSMNPEPGAEDRT